jgi:membrane-associated protease RseP (regulator of RpoE activity)
MKRKILIAVGLVALGISLIALPAHTTQVQSSQDNSVAALKREIAELKARLAATQEEQDFSGPVVAVTPEVGPGVEIERQFIDIQEPEGPVAPATPPARRLVMSLDGDGGSWLGVETQEVSSEKAKTLKLSSERGALIGKVLPDSPAAKAGLKENDVVTEINGQRVEGTAQFRRMIREIPGGRSVQLSVWREGKQQTIAATLGKSEERHNAMVKVSPQGYSFRIPEMPNMPEIPEIHNFGWDSGMLLSGKPRLGIDAEDLRGQLGTYFGVPEGEGILVRNVNTDSPAEKAGVKAGDVITTFNGERIRTAGELREKLAGIEGGKSVTLGLLRNKSEVKLTVELPAPATQEKRKIAFRTNI